MFDQVLRHYIRLEHLQMSVSGCSVAAIQRRFLKNSVSETVRKLSREHLVKTSVTAQEKDIKGLAGS